MDGWFGTAYRGSEWIMRLAYINILWVVFILSGLIVFGFFPATAAMFAVTRKWVMGESEEPIFKTFWNSYKKDFIQSNLIGLILLVLGFFLYFDLKFAQSQQGILSLLRFFFLGLLFFYFIMTLYIFPVFSHYKLKTFGYIRYSFIIAIGRPVQTFLMIVGSVIVYYLLTSIPGLIPFFSGSLISIVLMWGAAQSFPKLIKN